MAVLVSHRRESSHLCIPFRFLLDNTNKISRLLPTNTPPHRTAPRALWLHTPASSPGAARTKMAEEIEIERDTTVTKVIRWLTRMDRTNPANGGGVGRRRVPGTHRHESERGGRDGSGEGGDPLAIVGQARARFAATSTPSTASSPASSRSSDHGGVSRPPTALAGEGQRHTVGRPVTSRSTVGPGDSRPRQPPTVGP